MHASVRTIKRQDYRHQIQKQEQRESDKQGQNCLVGKKGQWM